MGYINTALMAAHIFTKFYPKDKRETWKSVSKLVGIFEEKTYEKELGRAGHGHDEAVTRMSNDVVKPSSKCMMAYDDPADDHYYEGFNPFIPDDDLPIAPLLNPKQRERLSALP